MHILKTLPIQLVMAVMKLAKRCQLRSPSPKLSIAFIEASKSRCPLKSCRTTFSLLAMIMDEGGGCNRLEAVIRYAKSI
uniref:Uncharacterized protein n=1 Tax=Nelumbo nucifera TaxID=4432 RepID=A0A822YJE8_NELNU|nr:TPA_asm: hypothetical protein HUJ06_004954 [Nelumbo nucifera]